MFQLDKPSQKVPNRTVPPLNLRGGSVLPSPIVHGSAVGLEHGIGFVVFIEDKEMTRECFSYDEDAPRAIRRGRITISRGT